MAVASRSSGPVVIVGGGWAGLAAAVELASYGVQVRLFEAARQLGGRARSLRFNDLAVDNGQHLMIGAYRATLALMDKVGRSPRKTLQRQTLGLSLRDRKGPRLALRTPRLPAPLHLLAGLMTARGLSLRDRRQAIRFGRRLAGLTLDADGDISVRALLHSEQQTPALVRGLWNPLCLAMLNTPPRRASARLFLAALKETFLALRAHSDLLIPTLDLGRLLPSPCADFVEARGGRIELGCRVNRLHVHHNRVQGVWVGERLIRASQVIVATHPVHCRRLLENQGALRSIRDKLAALGSEPIVTLYLQYPPSVRLPQAMTGLLDGTAQWLFDRRLCGQPGLMAVVISGRGEHMAWERDRLVQTVCDELRAAFPHWPQPGSTLLIREKRATFSCTPGVDRLRPANRTPLPGCWLAGDYTDTGLPATLEGAVRSGLSCAGEILQQELVNCNPR